MRAGQSLIAEDLPCGLIGPRPAPSGGAASDGTTLVTGKLKAEISSEGLVRFSRADGGAEPLSEEKAHFWWPDRGS